MFTASFTGKRIRAIAIILVMSMCLPLFSGALAASAPVKPFLLTVSENLLKVDFTLNCAKKAKSIAGIKIIIVQSVQYI